MSRTDASATKLSYRGFDCAVIPTSLLIDRRAAVREVCVSRAQVTGRAISVPLMLIIAVAGCALQPSPPEQRTTTVQVKVPVAVPCFTEDERPVLPPPTPVAEGATADQMAAALRADIENEKLYAAAVDALFLRCMGAPK